MHTFIAKLDEKLQDFYPYLDRQVELPDNIFTRRQGILLEFIRELKETAQHLISQKEKMYAELYAKRLVLQFDALQTALAQQQTVNIPVFQSAYRFPRNIHQLPVEKRLVEYKKALRALNDKLSWLTEQSYLCTEPAKKQDYIAQIQETEYRKQKCLKAIEALE